MLMGVHYFVSAYCMVVRYKQTQTVNILFSSYVITWKYKIDK